MSRPQIFAHRGARRVAPENTIPAFAAALEMGVDGIELDVHLSADGRLVVIHDFTVQPTSDGRRRVDQLTAAELALLDVGNPLGAAYPSVGVPTLDEVLDLVGRRCRVNVEIKSEHPDGGPAVEPVARLIHERMLFDQVIVSSFNPITLIKMRYVDPRIALGLLYEEPLPPHLRRAWFTPILAPDALHPWHPLVDADTVQWARDRRLAVNVWTVNEVEEARRLADLGVDALITDVPDLLIAALS